MESIHCIICNSDNASNYKKFEDAYNTEYFFALVKCECGLIFLNPRPDKKEMSKYYNDSYKFGEVPSHIWIKIKEEKLRIKKEKKKLKK